MQSQNQMPPPPPSIGLPQQVPIPAANPTLAGPTITSSSNIYQNGQMAGIPAPGLKQQYLPPRQQLHTNGFGSSGAPETATVNNFVNGNNNLSGNASPALNQPLNSAYLPPPSLTLASSQPPLSRPNMYSPSSMAPVSKPPLQQPAPAMIPSSMGPIQQNSQIPQLSQAPSLLSSQSTTAPTNLYQSVPVAKSGLLSSLPPTLATTSTPTIVNYAPPSNTLTNVDKVTYGLQNVHLNNNGNGIMHQPSVTASQPVNNKLKNENNQTMNQGASSIPLNAMNTNLPPLQNPYPMQAKSAVQNLPPSMPSMPPQQQPLNNGLPPMNQFAPSIQQLPQQNQFNSALPVQQSNTTYGKRPMYPQQIPQQQPNPMNNFNQYPQAPLMSQPQPNQSMPTPTSPMHQQYHQPQQSQPNNANNVVARGFDSMWGHNTIDLMQYRHVLPTLPVEPPKISLEHQFYESVNCSPDIFRCTLTKIPESNSLLQKSRLPLGILIHPFRDLNNLPVIQCSTIVRCRSCRTYINPFVYFVDSKKWKCNLCFRINELPDEFQYDPVSKSYGDVTRRPEVKSSTIEFIAPSEYMLRPPQPAIYLFLLDVSLIAQQSGYLRTVCDSLAEHLESMPGDARTQIGFVAYNSAVHFYSLAEGFNQPHEITVVDIDDPFLPCPDNLLINLNECKELITDLLTQLPNRFANTHDTNSALGAALQVAFKLMQQTGGRVTVFQTCLPNVGPGALQSRENPNERSAKEIQHLGPATDFYKRHALECSGQQIAVDLFLMNSQYTDLATISGISKFSGGCIHHFPLFNITKPQQVDSFKRCFERYLTRKIGFESVMRIRCTRGLTIHTFHGNFFVRSTDLLSLPNVNPDAGYGMQISYEESLGDSKTVCFQAALLYTSSKGERRIRVHTLCLPISNCLTDIIHSADAQAIIGLISKMAVDRSLQSSITDARDAFINASCDIFSAFHLAQNIKSLGGQLVAPSNLALLPLYMLALLKHTAFRTGTSTRLDDRVFAMCELKTLPLDQLIRFIYPDLYHLDCLYTENNNNDANNDPNAERPEPPILQLSAECLKSRSMFLLDCGTNLLLLVGSNVPPTILKNVFGVQSANEIPDISFDLPNTGTPDCDSLHTFLEAINAEKPFTPPIQIIRDNSPYRSMFTEKLVDDRSESSLSYYEFLQHLRTQIK